MIDLSRYNRKSILVALIDHAARNNRLPLTEFQLNIIAANLLAKCGGNFNFSSFISHDIIIGLPVDLSDLANVDPTAYESLYNSPMGDVVFFYGYVAPVPPTMPGVFFAKHPPRPVPILTQTEDLSTASSNSNFTFTNQAPLHFNLTPPPYVGSFYDQLSFESFKSGATIAQTDAAPVALRKEQTIENFESIVMPKLPSMPNVITPISSVKSSQSSFGLRVINNLLKVTTPVNGTPVNGTLLAQSLSELSETHNFLNSSLTPTEKPIDLETIEESTEDGDDHSIDDATTTLTQPMFIPAAARRQSTKVNPNAFTPLRQVQIKNATKPFVEMGPSSADQSIQSEHSTPEKKALFKFEL